MIKRFVKKYILKPNLCQESFDAYYLKLPKNIQVKWFRDEGYIVGKIDTGDNEFSTQGKNADDFIKMVNDAVFTMYDIPEDYIDVIDKFHAYIPPAQEMDKLNNKTISSAKLGFKKNEEIFKIA